MGSAALASNSSTFKHVRGHEDDALWCYTCLLQRRPKWHLTVLTPSSGLWAHNSVPELVPPLSFWIQQKMVVESDAPAGKHKPARFRLLICHSATRASTRCCGSSWPQRTTRCQHIRRCFLHASTDLPWEEGSFHGSVLATRKPEKYPASQDQVRRDLLRHRSVKDITIHSIQVVRKITG